MIARLFEARSTMAACAGLAALMSNCTVEEAMAQATLHFRSVCASRLSFEHFVSSPTSLVPIGPEFFAVTELTELGECDAFVSHSWHDDPRSRWLALQQWRESFVKRHGREPRIWFDKCCIDQTDVEQNLRGLPIFLSGCKEILVLCGPTYLSRLWCIVELFTFVHMGGSKSRMVSCP